MASSALTACSFNCFSSAEDLRMLSSKDRLLHEVEQEETDEQDARDQGNSRNHVLLGVLLLGAARVEEVEGVGIALHLVEECAQQRSESIAVGGRISAKVSFELESLEGIVDLHGKIELLVECVSQPVVFQAGAEQQEGFDLLTGQKVLGSSHGSSDFRLEYLRGARRFKRVFLEGEHFAGRRPSGREPQ